MNKSTLTPPLKTQISPLPTHKERLSIWEKARGIWKHRQPDPIKELKKMRREWERDFNSKN